MKTFIFKFLNRKNTSRTYFNFKPTVCIYQIPHLFLSFIPLQIPQNSEPPLRKMRNLLSSMITLTASINRRNQKYPKLWDLIKICNVVVLLFKLLENYILTCLENTSYYMPFSLMYNIISGKNSTGYVLEELGYLTSIMFVILCGCLVYSLRSQVSMIKTTKEGSFGLFILYYPLIVSVIIQLLYPTQVMYLIKCFRQLDILPAHIYIQSILSSLLILLVTVYNYKKRVFNLFLPIILAFVQIFDSLAANFFILFFSVVFLWQSKEIIDRCSYVHFIVVCIFNIVEDFSGNKQLSSLLSLGFYNLLLGVAIVVSQTQKFNLGNEKENCRFLAESVRKLKKNQPKNMDKRSLIKMEMIFRKFYQRYHADLDIKNDFPVNKRIEQLSYEELFKVVDLTLEVVSQKNLKDFQLKKQSLLFRIENIYKIHKTINDIIEFIDCGRSQTMSYKQKYSRSYVNLVFLQEFMSKQPDNTKVNKMIKLNSVHSQFIDEVLKIMIKISSFWDETCMNVLIEEMIEKNFNWITAGVEKLRILLAQLKKEYMAKTESKLYELVIKLVYPDSTQFVPLEPQSIFGKQKQDTVYYFVVRSSKIVDISSPFLKILDCASFQLVGSPISKIMPEEIAEDLKKRQTEAITFTKTTNTIPIICGNFIKAFGASVKLRPKVNSSIEFFYFLQNIQKQEKRAYLYLNSVDLSIRYVSQSFFELLGLTNVEVEKRIRKNALYLNSFLRNIDPNILISALQTEKMLKCELSTQNLITGSRVGKPNTLSCIVQLQNLFETNVLLSLYIINPAQMANDHFLKARKNLQLSTTAIDIIKARSIQSDPLTKSYQKRFMENKDKQVSKLYNPDQKIYCRIENPIKQKIQQKKSQLSNNSQHTLISLNYTNCSIFLSVIMLIVFILIGILLIIYCGKQNISLDQAIEGFQKITTQINSMIRGTYGIYTQYVIFVHRQAIQNHLNTFVSQGSVSLYLKQIQEQLHLGIKQFQLAFTGFGERDIFKNVSYVLTHHNYNVTTDLSQPTLMEYISNLKIGSQKINNQEFSDTLDSTHPLNFILNNYLTISQLQIPFDSMDELIELYFQELYGIGIVLIIISVIALGLFYSVLYMVKSNLQTLRDMFYIFSFVDHDFVKTRFQQIRKGLKEFANQIPKDTLKKMAKLNLQRQAAKVAYDAKARQSQQKLKDARIEDKQDEFLLENKHVVTNKNKPYLTAFYQLKWLFVIIVLFFGIVGGFFYKIQVDLREDKINLTYYSEIEKLIYGELINSADMFHYNILASEFGKSSNLPPNVREKKSSLNKFVSKGFESSFAQLYQKQSQILKQSLCEITIEKSYLDQLISCKDIGVGILSKGYIQTSEYYDFKTQKIKRNLVSLIEVSQSEKYMNLFIHAYVREKMLHQFRHFRVNIAQNRQKLQVKYNFNMVNFAIGVAVAIFLFIAYLVSKLIPLLTKIQRTGVGYFKILPRQVLLKMEVSAYLNQHKLLNRLTLL